MEWNQHWNLNMIIIFLSYVFFTVFIFLFLSSPSITVGMDKQEKSQIVALVEKTNF